MAQQGVWQGIEGFEQQVNSAEQQSLADHGKAMSGSAGNLVNAAGTGFRLDPDAAATLIKACDDSIQELDSALRAAKYLSSPPQLGSLRGAQ